MAPHPVAKTLPNNSQWMHKRLRFVTTLPSKQEVRGIPPETDVSFVPMEAVGERGGLDTSRSRALSQVLGGYTYFRNGDILIAKITPCFENEKGALAQGLLNGIGFGTTELHVLRPDSTLHPKFLFYVTLSHAFRKLGEAEMYGAGGQKRIPEEFIRDFPVAIPAFDEQGAIVDFLDRETRKIDQLIEKQQQLAIRLRERRDTTIYEALTKGIRAKSKFKASGLLWLGEIPSHWRVIRLKYVAVRKSGHTPARTVPEYWENCSIPWISLNEVGYLAEHDYISETKNKITTVPAGSIVALELANPNSLYSPGMQRWVAVESCPSPWQRLNIS